MVDSPSLSYSILTSTPCLLDIVCQVHSLKSMLNTSNECLMRVLELHSRSVSISQIEDMMPSMHKTLENLKLWTDMPEFVSFALANHNYPWTSIRPPSALGLFPLELLPVLRTWWSNGPIPTGTIQYHGLQCMQAHHQTYNSWMQVFPMWGSERLRQHCPRTYCDVTRPSIMQIEWRNIIMLEEYMNGFLKRRIHMHLFAPLQIIEW